MEPYESLSARAQVNLWLFDREAMGWSHTLVIHHPYTPAMRRAHRCDVDEHV